MRILWVIVFLPLILGGQSIGGGTIPQPEQRIAFVGNSLTAAGPIYTWTGQWGMAASQPDKDYVHRTQLLLTAKTGVIPEIRIFSADLHRETAIAVAAEDVADYRPTVLVVQMGDNAEIGATYDQYRDAYRRLRDAAPGATLVYVGIWRELERGDDYIRQLAREDKAAYVEIHDLFLDAANQAQGCTDTNGVCWHPGDTGMAAIASRIIAAIGGISGR